MTTETLVIELNDAALSLSDGERVLAASPGYAVADGGQLKLGEAARGSARINPRTCFNRFWAELDQQPLTRPAGRARHHADLAYFHLQSLLQTAGVAQEYLVAVPPGVEPDRLALLLGICQSLDMRVTGLVAAPLLPPLSSDAAVAGACVLDISLHGQMHAELSADSQLALSQEQWLKGPGLLALHDAWARHIAGRFLRETRFDPLHDARSEQALYDRLDDWRAQALAGGVVRAQLQAGQRQHAVDLAAGEWADAAQAIYAPLRAAIQDADGPLWLSDRVAGLPGLLDGLAAAPRVYSSVDTARAALAAVADIRSDAQAPAFVTRLPVLQEGVSLPRGERSPDIHASDVRPLATHRLESDVAYPLAAGRLHLDDEDAEPPQLRARGDGFEIDASSAQAQLNGRSLGEPVCLRAGDELQIGRRRWRFIAVAD